MRHQPQTNPSIPLARPKWEVDGRFPAWNRRRTIENVLFVLACVWLFTSTVRESHRQRHPDHAQHR